MESPIDNKGTPNDKDAERQRDRQCRNGADHNVTIDGSMGSYRVDNVRRRGS